MRELNEKELSQVSGGAIQEVSRAPGSGQITQGQGEGLNTQNENPSGKAPPGQN
jgi:bacteriocin-like protein